MSFKRLLLEYKEIALRPPQGVVAGPIDESNLFEWECLFSGPEDTPYDGGCFRCTLTFPKDYPLNPPVMRFSSPLWHPNIYPDGTVCISILHPPEEDKFGYERSCERWSPVQSIEKVILSVISMLAEPNDESPANVDAAKMWRTDRQAFLTKADECVRKSLGWA